MAAKLLLFLFSLFCLSFGCLGFKHSFIARKSLRFHVHKNGRVPDGKVLSYAQRLDHFNYEPAGHQTFQQRYAINYDYWGGAANNSPIFLYPGDESPLRGVFDIGFFYDNAQRFKALLVTMEHRYYGESHPFGSMEEAYTNSSTLAYFNSEQALADCAELIIDLKKNLSAQGSPVIVIGGSYGGMLAAWLRLKYPHIVLGALASSAPVLYFDDLTPQDGYLGVVTKDFKETSESCYKRIRKSWAEIDRIASQPNGLTVLSKKFKTCRPLNNATYLKDYLEYLYESCAQYDDPIWHPVKSLCNAIDGAAQGTDTLRRIFSGVQAVKGKLDCLDVDEYNYINDTVDRRLGWTWQTCTEIVMPIGGSSGTGNASMFQDTPFNLTEFVEDCRAKFGVTARPHWITIEFGGHNMKFVLKNFGSNIIFSNGLRDPYSIGGVLENISSSIVALTTNNGSHCLDMAHATPSDPEWLVKQRNAEIKIIESWIAQDVSRIASTANLSDANLHH